jgi:hypothetical protein
MKRVLLLSGLFSLIACLYMPSMVLAEGNNSEIATSYTLQDRLPGDDRWLLFSVLRDAKYFFDTASVMQTTDSGPAPVGETGALPWAKVKVWVKKIYRESDAYPASQELWIIDCGKREYTVQGSGHANSDIEPGSIQEQLYFKVCGSWPGR